MRLNELKALDLLDKLRKKEISGKEILDDIFSRIEERKEINAYISLLKGYAYKKAAKIDEMYKRNEIKKQSIAGIPIAIKDNITVKGYPTTCASKILDGFNAPYDASVVEKIDSNEGVMIGKTNMDEFAMGSSTETSYFGPTLNPNDTNCIPGGSSGGSAAAVADNQTILALGSDTGGSIRQPAALCGVVGLKPTYGLVSRYGLVAFASSLDQIGPLTKDVKDAALLLNVIAGHDKKDSTSVNLDLPDYLEGIDEGINNIKIGIPDEYFIEGMDEEVKNRINKVIDLLRSNGAVFDKVSLPHTGYAVADYYILAPSEASSNLSRYDGVKYGFRAELGKDNSDFISMYFSTRADGFGSEVKRRILLGTYALSSGYYDAYYLKAQKVRTLIKHDFEEAFKKFDILITATSPTPAFKIGEKTDDPLQMYLSDIFTISVNLAGIPAISIPAGKTKEGLPIGVQFMSKHFNEKILLRVAYAAEQIIAKGDL